MRKYGFEGGRVVHNPIEFCDMWLRVELLGAAVEEEPACRPKPWCIRGESDEARDQRLDPRHLRWVEVVRVSGVDRAKWR